MEGLSNSSTQQPTLFRFKIESFSSLSTSVSIKRFESCEFDAGDYKWKLAFYANGNEKVGGKDHISLYLVLADSSCIDDNKELLVSFSLLVFDQILLKYLKVHVMSSFHATKSESGFEMFLPLNIFNDPSNGYLVDDTCVFGAEVSSIESTNKKQRYVPFKFTWKLEKFSELKDAIYQSEKFTVEGHDFKLKLFPKGQSGKGTSLSLFLALADPLSLFLALADPGKLSSATKLHVKFTLRIIDQVNKKHKEKASEHNFSWREIDWGYINFLLLSELNLSTGCLVNDTCIFEVHITRCEPTKDRD
ncbi:Ubiquitin carboxyl-terminal hydrolase [Thalictrum thalictroides]|uniref:Ubiquitin carboxyl-terminal hydrolase n=1 Tax=Thalictrum thalictroides TaxID=46969 RepID=A0A7J6X0N6_THATH|nr:Ubiquitin carboxyl-terminal hydrolase [Thalictrum thalictroides]